MSTKENTFLQSLEVNAKEEVLDAWVEEAEKRWQAFKRGEIRGIPAEEIFPSLKKKRKTT